MTQKAISLSTAVAILVAYLWSQLQPNDALFSLMSANTALNIGLLALAALMVRLSFLNSYKTKSAYVLTVCGAIAAIAVSAIGLMANTYNFNFLNWLGPLDFLVVGQVGIILSICALSYQHQPVMPKTVSAAKLVKLPLPRVAMPRLAINTFRSLRAS
ncbi:MAG TPA: hypothetical protein VFH37_03165 [Candidatus Saccharimonadales bacterium]|nr:hypothetical protein [Candidatus Saccharimonadales bacterium]